LVDAAAPVLAAAVGRAVAQVDRHVTLCFLGAVTSAQFAALCERAAQLDAPSFELVFERLELWRRSRILAATVAQVPAAGIALALALANAAQAVGLSPSLAEWRPHLTLLRGVTEGLAGLVADAAPADPEAPAGDATALPRLTLRPTRFYLAESQGLGAHADIGAQVPRYARLVSWPLRS
jgi:2'-5' RNA ligase